MPIDGNDTLKPSLREKLKADFEGWERAVKVRTHTTGAAVERATLPREARQPCNPTWNE